MRLDGRDSALEEPRGLGLADEGHQYARDGDDDARKVERPAPVRDVRYVSPLPQV